MKIGVLGGSFNPPHFGHILLAFWALADNDLDQILIVPCYRHPFGKRFISFDKRIKMCRIAFKKFGKFVRVSDIEKRLGGISRTLFTLKALKRKNPDNRYFLLVGSDILSEKEKWYRISELERNFGIIVVPRGIKKQGLYIPDIKSRVIRDRIKNKKTVANFLPRPVLDYIKKNRLYSN
jgi:nicotinate-nucleotide adenylyltransferase